jgi:hypothetical protein
MGVWHFAGVGTSPGAVTSALSYLKNNEPIWRKRNEFKGQIIESIVIFTSQEISSGTKQASEYIWNDYMKRNNTPEKGNFRVLEVIKNFIDKEIKTVMPPEAKVYVCITDTEDYNDCFEKVAQCLLKFSPPGKVGKHIWANLTGGTNILNAAIMQAAFLSGLISKVYYTFVAQESDKKYLQPFTNDESYFKWNEIELIKTTIDQAYYEILRILNEKEEGLEVKELYSRLKNGNYWNYFGEITSDKLVNEFLNKMPGIDRIDNTNKNKINEYGKKLLEMLDKPLIKALTERGKGEQGLGEPELKVL